MFIFLRDMLLKQIVRDRVRVRDRDIQYVRFESHRPVHQLRYRAVSQQARTSAVARRAENLLPEIQRHIAQSRAVESGACEKTDTV